MDLVDDIDPVTALGRGILDLLADLADILDAVIGRGVDLHYVQRSAGGDVLAGAAFAAGTSVHRSLAVDGPGEYLGDAGLAGAAGPAEQIGMSDALRQYLIFQCLYNVVLPLYLIKRNRAPFAVQRHVGHGSSLHPPDPPDPDRRPAVRGGRGAMITSVSHHRSRCRPSSPRG